MKWSSKFWYNTSTKEIRTKKPQSTNNWEHWDSKAEFDFYYHTLKPLVRSFGNDLRIVRQRPIQLANSKHFGKVQWVCDFVIIKRSILNPVMIIEYKGEWILHNSGAISSLRNQLILLEFSNQKLFENVVFVGSKLVAGRFKSIPCFEPNSEEFKDFVTSRLSKVIS